MNKRLLRWLPVVPAVVGLAACAHGRSPDLPAPVRFSMQVRQILDYRASSPEYYRARTRLDQLGPEVDAALVLLARDPDVKTVVRGNALILLADRGSQAALPVLSRVVLTEPDEEVRVAAVQALQRLVPTHPGAVNLLRAAAGDPSRLVRLSAIQALDIRDVASIRALLEHETDPEVRKVAVQLVSIAESRGAPLAPDRRGALRTAGGDGDPQKLFRPVHADSLAEVAVGDLRVELPNAADIPLAPLAEVVSGVVPAFFSPDRSRVVYEADREIRVVNLATRRVRQVGPGIAPRLVPFTNTFVFLRPLPGEGTDTPEGTELHYAVYRAGFGDGEPEWLGELRATARMDRHANYSPVRWMVVSESTNGFALKGEGVSTFELPNPAGGSAPQGPPPGGRNRLRVDGGSQ